MPSSPKVAYSQRRPDLAMVASLCCALVGLAVIIGWHFNLTWMVQLSPAYPPMPYGSALAFLLVGAGLFCAAAERRTSARIAAVIVWAAVVLDLVVGPIGASLAVRATHIPPNAVLNFTLAALALWFATGTRPRPRTVALLGSIVAAIALTSLFGYAARLDAAYAWQGSPAMAIHGAATFALVGLVLVNLAWRQTQSPAGHLPDWLPIPAGVATGIATVVLWQALLQDDRSGLAYSTLFAGGALAVALGLAIRFAQTARRALAQAEQTARALNAEVLERRAAEEHLRKTEEDLNRAQQVARTGSWRLDVRRDELRWSAETYRMFGVPEGTPLTYETFLGAVHPEDRALVDGAWGDALEGAPYEVEHRIVVNGSVKWVRERARLEFDEAGGLLGGFGTVQDITERRDAEDALRRSEARWNAAIERLEQGVVVANEAAHLIYWNPAARILHGFRSAEEGLAPLADMRHVFELWTTDASRQLTVDEWPMSRILRGEILRHVELRLRRLDQGWEKFVAYSGAIVETAGGERLVFLSIYDLTEQRRTEEALRQSEHFYRQTLESIPGMVFTTRPDGYCDYQSQQWVDFTGVPMREHLGDGWNRLLHPDDQPRAFAAWQAAVEEHGPYDLEYRVRRYDGEYEWFKVRGAPIRDARGKIARWFGVAANIDALKRAEQDLAAAKVSAEQAKAVAEAANRTKDYFLAVLSHELRTPLAPVLSGIALLQREPALPAGAREVLDVLHRNVKAESRLIDDLLDLTRIERGKIELDRRRVDARSIIDRAIEVCRPDLEAKRLQLTITGDEDVFPLDADAARLQQVLSNLLTNAIKFTREGGCVGVRCRAYDGWLSIDVHDDGIGIEREALGRIFDAFAQAERSITRRFGGLGLGLAISKALVELHGGTIEAHSEGVGKGSTFRVRLPLVTARTSRPRKPREGESASRDGRGLRALHVLLVEDHGDTAVMIAAVLERAGHRVARATDIASALDAVQRAEFDLLVSDLGLPDGSGLELIRRLRASGSAIPAIAVSGYGQAVDIAQSQGAGFQVHLVKPIEPHRLFEAMERLIEGART